MRLIRSTLATVLAPLLIWGACSIAARANDHSDNGWSSYNWLKSAEEQQSDALKARASREVGDPFATVPSGGLWHERYEANYARLLGPGLTLTYDTSNTVFDEALTTQYSNAPSDLSGTQTAGLLVQPVDPVSLRAQVHHTQANDTAPGQDTLADGAGVTAETHLPTKTFISLGVSTENSGADTTAATQTAKTDYVWSVQQPLPRVPLTAEVKAQYESATTTGSSTGHAPTLEQSLQWKPSEATVLKFGLRQQQYEEYPGVANAYNQALFADWNQHVLNDVSWHSYAEVVNTRGLIDQAPAAPLASGANGTPQATTPDSKVSPGSALPLSASDRTLTFSTGPSVKLHKDLSASLEYSNRWDTGYSGNGINDEHRVSVSVKGTF